MGYVVLHENDLAEAEQLFRAALAIFRDLGDRRGMAECVIGLGAIAVQANQQERAISLLGAGTQTLHDMGSVLSHSNEADYDLYLDALRSRFAPEEFEEHWQAACKRPLEESIEAPQLG
jgi:hypothetical protein